MEFLYRPGFDRWCGRRCSPRLQALQNARRRDEHLALAEETQLPDEEQLTQDTIDELVAFTRENWLPGRRAAVRQHQDVRRAARRVHRAARPAGAPPARAVRGAADVPGVGAVLRARARTPRRTWRTRPVLGRDQGHGRARAQAAGRRAARPRTCILVSPGQLRDPRTSGRTPSCSGGCGPRRRSATRSTPATRTCCTWRCSCCTRRCTPTRSRSSTTATSRSCSARARRCSTRCKPVPAAPQPDPGPARRRTTSATRWSRTLGAGEWAFDFMVQVQTDPHRMPIEDATVKWPERLSPYVPVARLRLPAQRFDSDAQLRLRRRPALQPVAQPARAPSAGQLEPGPAADVLGARHAAPADERRRSTSSPPATRRSPWTARRRPDRYVSRCSAARAPSGTSASASTSSRARRATRR